jgi:hypothetical protein
MGLGMRLRTFASGVMVIQAGGEEEEENKAKQKKIFFVFLKKYWKVLFHIRAVMYK